MASIEPSLTFVSLLAGNADPIYQRLIDALATASGLRIRLVAAPSWAERTRMLREGEAALAAVCGATYAEWNAGGGPALRLLAAPVMAGARYAGRPVYFSDLIVRHDSPRRSFAELRGVALAYNEAGSFSGSVILGARLAELGEDAGYFGRLDAAGSHQESLRRVLRGDADAA
ncbi:MAG TPA: PhnD/SsuA/transferrin family substrate-binding protein, partial [Herpetosiphonaceae bacterium]